MNSTIAALLTQDALTNGAIYALLAMTLVMVYSITRVIFIPQGEIVSLAALTLAALEMSQVPGTLWLLCGAAVLAALVETIDWLRGAGGRWQSVVLWLAYPLAVYLLVIALYAQPIGIWGRMALALAITVPFGPLMYRLAFRPLANASVLVLLIVAMALHFVLVGFGLMVFGPEGVRTTAIFQGVTRLGGVAIKLQGLFVIAVAIGLILGMAWFFGRTITGKALRATAFNRTGARLVGIRTEQAGMRAFFVASLIGAISGLLIAPMTTIYFDTGFLIGLKGFIAAIMGGLGGYVAAALGAVLLGLIESFSSFYASSFKDVIVFALIIPVLLWRNIGQAHDEEEEE